MCARLATRRCNFKTVLLTLRSARSTDPSPDECSHKNSREFRVNFGVQVGRGEEDGHHGGGAAIGMASLLAALALTTTCAGRDPPCLGTIGIVDVVVDEV